MMGRHAWSVVALFAAAGIAGACDTGRYAYIVDNRTDDDLVARVTLDWTGQEPTVQALALPGHSRLEVAHTADLGPWRVGRVEILTMDCGVVLDFDAESATPTVSFSDGRVMVVNPGLVSDLEREFPVQGPEALPAPTCQPQAPERSASPTLRSSASSASSRAPGTPGSSP